MENTKNTKNTENAESLGEKICDKCPDISGNFPNYTHENNGIYNNPFVNVDQDWGWGKLSGSQSDILVNRICGDTPDMPEKKALDKFLAYFDDDEDGLTPENIKKIHPNFPESFYDLIKKASDERFGIVKDEPKIATVINEGKFKVSFD